MSLFAVTQWVTISATDENSMNLFTAQSHLCELLSVTEKTHCIQNNLCLYCKDKKIQSHDLYCQILSTDIAQIDLL